MNYFIKAQITNMISFAKTFENSCKMAATADDGYMDKAETKALQKISAATAKYIAELKKIQDQSGFLDLTEIAVLFRKKAA